MRKILKTRILMIIVLFQAILLLSVGIVSPFHTKVDLDHNDGARFTRAPTISWPLFRGDIQNTGATGDSTLPANNQTLWTFDTSDTSDTIKSSPIINNGFVYFATSGGTLYCVWETNGTEVWRKKIEAIDYSSPGFGDGKIVIGTLNGTIFCLDSKTGSMLWNRTTQDKIPSSPRIYNNTVFITSYDGNLYALNLTNGITIWNFSTSGWVHTSPAIWNDRIYFGGCDGILHSVYISNGTTAWEFTTGNYIVSSPAISLGRVYFGTHNGNIYSMDALTGDLLWQNSTNSTIKSSPAIANDKVIFCAEDGKVYCFNTTTGVLLWEFTTEGEIYSSPAIARDKLVVGSADHKIYCLDLFSGEHVWSFTTGGVVDSSPAIANDKVFIGSDDGTLYCFGNQSVEQPIPGTPLLYIHSPKDFQNITTYEFEVYGNATIKKGSIKYVEARIDNGSWIKANGTSNWSIIINSSEYKKGTHIISARANDGSNFSAEKNITIIFLSHSNDEPWKPSVSIITPVNLQELTTLEFEIQGNVSVANGSIERVELRMNNDSWLKVNGTTDWKIKLNFSGFQNGVHVITVRSFNGITYSAEYAINITLNYTKKDNNNNNGNGNDVDDNNDPEDTSGWLNTHLLLVAMITISLIMILIIILFNEQRKLKN